MLLKVSSSPHIHSPFKTSRVMFEVLLALLPAVGASIYFFNYRAVLLILNCICCAFLTEAIICRVQKKKLPLADLSAVVTGLLLALILPPSTTWYAASLGSIFAIAIGTPLFGGLGSNIFNPALVARAFLMAAYPRMLTTYIDPF